MRYDVLFWSSTTAANEALERYLSPPRDSNVSLGAKEVWSHFVVQIQRTASLLMFPKHLQKLILKKMQQ